MLGLWITLAVLLALAIFLWRLRLGLYVVFGRGQAAADLTIGPFRVRLVPSKETKKTPQETKKTGKPKKEPKDLAEAAKKIPKPKLEDLQDAARTLWPAAKKALRRTRRGIRVDPLRLSATLGGAEDPAAAAELYGGLHALVWTGMPALEKLVVIRDPGIHLGIDFDAQETRAEGELGISIRLGTLIAVGTQLAVPAIGWLRRFMKRRRMPPHPKQQTTRRRTPRRVTRKDGIHGRDNGQEETPQRFDAFHDGQDPGDGGHQHHRGAAHHHA